MIDPIEAVIKFFLTTEITDVVGNRIAEKHYYGDGWAEGKSSIVVRPDGGSPSNFIRVQNQELDVRCYGDGSVEAMTVWRRLIEVTRPVDRIGVDTTNGRALIYDILQLSGVSLLWDTDIKMDYALVFMEANIAEKKLP